MPDLQPDTPEPADPAPPRWTPPNTPDDAPSPAGEPAGTDKVSVTAFVLSLPGAALLAIPLGILGLVRTGAGRRRGRGFAVAALGISVAWMVAGVAVVLSGALGTLSGAVSDGAPQGLSASEGLEPLPQASSPSEAPTASVAVRPAGPLAKPTRVNWQKLKPAMCFISPDASGATTVKVVDCRATHDAEVMLNTSLPGPKTWPGDKAMSAPLEEVCRPVFEAYVGIGYDESHLDFDWFTTETAGWNAGDHTTICLVYDPDDQQLTRTLRNAME